MPLFRITPNTNGEGVEETRITYLQLLREYDEEELLTMIDWTRIEFAE